MSNIEIRKKFAGEWALNVSANSDEGFPSEIFLWTLDSKGGLDEFQSVANADELHYPKHQPRDSNFGIRLVRHTSASKLYETEEDIDKAIVVIKSTYSRLLAEYAVRAVETIEVYP